MPITTLEAMLLTNCQFEQVTPADARRRRDLCPGYESLLARGYLTVNGAGHLETSTYGERAIDEYIADEQFMRAGSPAASPAEYAWIVLLGMGIAMLVIGQIQ